MKRSEELRERALKISELKDGVGHIWTPEAASMLVASELAALSEQQAEQHRELILALDKLAQAQTEAAIGHRVRSIL